MGLKHPRLSSSFLTEKETLNQHEDTSSLRSPFILKNSNMHIQIVPGSFARTAFYDPLREALIAEGYATSITPLPSIGMRHGRPPATMEEDAECIRAATEGLVEQGEDVVLVMHSYGGIPGMQSVEGFSRAERERAGKAGGVVKLVYLAAVVPEVGQSVNEIMAPWLEKYREMSYVKVEVRYLKRWAVGGRRSCLADVGRATT